MPFFSFNRMYIGKFMYICILKKKDSMTVHAQNRLITTAKRRESELCCIQGKAVGGRHCNCLQQGEKLLYENINTHYYNTN